MPFSPLPGILIEDLERLARHGVLELGSGGGELTDVLREAGVEPLTLDRRGPDHGIFPHLCGDALTPPLRGRFGVIVAGNLVRQCWQSLLAKGPETWQYLLVPGGTLWILEDEPTLTPPAARNYRDLQKLLAALDPGGRGDLMSLDVFRRAAGSWETPGYWSTGILKNLWAADPDGVAHWLAGGNPEPGGAIACLIDSLAEHGLQYGRYWWARWSLEESA